MSAKLAKNGPHRYAKGTAKPVTSGRKKGTPNKTTALIKDAVIQAAEAAGDEEGMIGYLTTQANPATER